MFVFPPEYVYAILSRQRSSKLHGTGFLLLFSYCGNTFLYSQVTSGIDCTKIGPVLLRFTPNSDDSNDDSYEPWGVAADPNGLYVVSDHHNHHIQVRI